MSNNNKVKKERGKKRNMIGWIIFLVIGAILGIGGAIGWSMLSREHNEARNVPLNGVDFSKLKDGTYVGEYEGGMYKWRVNTVQVEVVSGKVKEIKFLSSVEAKEGDPEPQKLFDRVIKAQSLQVDTISGATLTSKGYLKAVERALIKAVKK